ncbi:AMP-binding protein [Lysobacter fragariae]
MALLTPGGPLSRLYNTAPASVKDAFASAYGLKVLQLRYGGSFARHLEEYRERDSWSHDRLVEWQNAKLQDLLRHAVAHVPYYTRLRAKGEFPIEDVKTTEDLAKLPVLDKEAIRKDPDAFVATNAKPLHVLYTSGTTGMPLKLYRSTETIRDWYACFERRAREWSGVSKADRYAMLGGQLVVPVETDRPPFWVYNAPVKQLYMSAYHLSPKFMDAYLDEIVRRKVVHLYGYASAMDALAAHALQGGRTDVRLKVATSNAEPLFDHQRERIAQAFSCDVRDTYGNTELSVAAFECEARRMHLSMDVAVVEVLGDDGRACPAGEAGEFACTGLLNFDQVFIRYRPGDRGSLRANESPCSCGRHSPSLATIEGRADDVLVTSDGRHVGRLDPVFKGGMRLLEAQIIQVALDEVHVKVVPAPGYSDADAESIASRIRDRMGAVTVEVFQVAEIPRSANGKFRAVVNLIGK